MATVHHIAGFDVPDQVLSGIREASSRSGIDFEFLVAQAAQESGFRADAKASTSSATGLYQFIEQTWLGVVREHGADYGLQHYAVAIDQRPGGGFTVGDPRLRQEILDLREDPRLNALLAGELAADNAAAIQARTGRAAGPTELYLAHFLGAGQAGRLIEAAEATPHVPAAELFPAAAEANQAIFFRPDGTARTSGEVFGLIDAKMQRKLAVAAEASGLAPTTETPRIDEFAAFSPASPDRSSRASFHLGGGGGPAPSATLFHGPSVPNLGGVSLDVWSVLTASEFGDFSPTADQRRDDDRARS